MSQLTSVDPISRVVSGVHCSAMTTKSDCDNNFGRALAGKTASTEATVPVSASISTFSEIVVAVRRVATTLRIFVRSWHGSKNDEVCGLRPKAESFAEARHLSPNSTQTHDANRLPGN
eukprot:SAG31_NODE_4118_length_3565_cov_2.083670_5_plen_118_part_00